MQFEDIDLAAVPAARRPHLGIAHVPEGRQVFPSLTVMENLEMGAFLVKGSVGDQLERIWELFPTLKDQRRERAGALSGGQRVMVAFGRALMPDPKVLLLDEPSAGLAPIVVDRVFETIQRINETGVSIVIVEQNARRSLAMAHYGYVLDMGQNRMHGPGHELLEDKEVIELYLGSRGRLGAAVLRLREQHQRIRAEVG
jgi:ABC-type branched-subunit amino acid transport system ATPase component